MITYLTISAAIAGATGLFACIRSGQWHNTATAAFAAAAVSSSAALYSTKTAIANANIVGFGVPHGCSVMSASLPTLMLSCPVHVDMPVEHSSAK